MSSSFNDAYMQKPTLYSCHVCHDPVPEHSVYWYEATLDKASEDHAQVAIFTDTTPVVPVCLSCHMNPSSWLQPAHSVPDWLASRDCERLEGPRAN